MSTRISSEEVLLYLNYLGYKNINAQQLKEFVQDLKTLIKYEERKKSKESVSCEPTTKSKKSNLEEVLAFFNSLHAHETCASKAKTVPKKENVISVQIKRTKSKCTKHKEKMDLVQQQNQVTVEQEIPLEKPVEKGIKGLGGGDQKKSQHSLRPKSSFIRPTPRVNVKSDPVALYHQYKAEWERRKMPGEDQRNELRWAIREKMLSGPRCKV